MIQPDRRHLDEMARVFPHGLPSPDRAVTPDGAHTAHVDGPRVFLDGTEIYDGTRDVDPERGFFPCPKVVPAVAIASSGKAVLFQIPTPMVVGGVPISLVMRAELQRGWFGGQKVEVSPMVELPAQAQAMQLRSDGTFAYAQGGQIFENPSGQASDWQERASFGQEAVLGFDYLHDGSLAVCTAAENRELPRYWFVPDGQTRGVEVPLEQFAPQGREHFDWLRLRWTGIAFEQMGQFKQQNPALFDSEGILRPHAATISPSGRQALMVTLGQAGQALLYDGASKTSRALGQIDANKLDRAFWDVDRHRAAVLVGEDLHVFDLAGQDSIVLPGLRDVGYDKRDGSLTFLAPGQSEPIRVGIHQAHTQREASWWKPAHDQYRERLQAHVLGAQPEKAATGIQEQASSVSFGGTRLKRRAASPAG
ncbi:MAG: hypothetical protein AMXMBFR33_06520 [Candidatus Xenobia bacterium]